MVSTATATVFALILGVSVHQTQGMSDADHPGIDVSKMTTSNDDTGVVRQSVSRTDVNGGNGIFVVKSTLPPCTARVPAYTTETWVAVVPIEGKVTTNSVEVNGTTIHPSEVTYGPGEVMFHGPSMVRSVYNAECTPATYIAFYTSAKYTTVFIPYIMPAFSPFTLNATYADVADLMYPTIANKNGQWVPNEECLKKCGLKLPAAVQAAG